MKTEAAAFPASAFRAADFLALTKPRLNSLVVVTAGIGYYLGAAGETALAALAHTVVGAGLVAGAAAAFNQIAERDLDASMERTRDRPLPAGRVSPAEAAVFAAALTAAGLLQLAYAASRVAAAAALATLVVYVAIYTPLKRRTPWAAVVGAVPGALPPVIGWAAARGAVTAEAWTLFGVVFLWQLPHFHALSWLYKDDFARAGLPLLAVLDADGRRTAAHVLTCALLLLPMSLAPAAAGLGGPAYVAGAAVLGAAFAAFAVRFALRRSSGRARALFLASLVYLPLLWGLLVAERAF